jgi:methylated-DNA-protein-cysteine methyltransferase-like protein
MTTFELIYAVVRRIPQGKVASYGQVAALAGNPRWARAVGYALHRNPQPGVIPCHRVVMADGRMAPGFAFGGPDVQRALLEGEGVRFCADGRVDMAVYQWKTNE